MKRRRFLSIVVISLFLVSTLTSPAAAFGFPPPPEEGFSSDDQIHYINVNTESTSDCFLIESNGSYMLVDTSNPDLSTGGNVDIANDTANVNEVIRYLRHLDISVLDYVVLTHNHSDHIGGVPRLCEEGFINESTTVYYRTDALSYEEILYPEWDSATYIRACMDALEESGANTVCLMDENITDLTMELGDFTIEFMNLDADQDGNVDFCYENENNNSIVLMVSKGSVDTLLAGDVEADAEAAMLHELRSVEVLKVPHHGNRTSSSYEFIKTLQPETAIITANGYWQYGAYEYLMGIGSMVYTTGLCPGLAIVEAVGEDSYEIQCAVPYFLPSTDGWHTWLEDYYFVSWGHVVRDDWMPIDGEWFYFDEDGIMVTGEAEIDGESYLFSDTGELIS